MRIAVCCQWYRDAKGFDKSVNCLDPYRVGQRLYHLRGHEIHLIHAQSTNAWMGRNLMIYGSLEVKEYHPTLNNFDAWIFFDSDIVFGLEHILDMYGSIDDIYCFPYELRGSPNRYNVMKDNVHFPKTTGGIQEVDGCGAGAVMITRRVLERVEPMAFCPVQVNRNGRVSILSSDYNFCRKAKEAGFKIQCNFDLPVDHLC